MKAVLQRVSNASAEIDGKVSVEIGSGLLILLGVMHGDSEKEAELLADKIARLRIFSDSDGKLNISLLENAGGVLVVSNFTLGADVSKGRRPSFTKAAPAKEAQRLYQYFISCLHKMGIPRIGTGEFGADMQISLTNVGPVTIVLDTDEMMRK